MALFSRNKPAVFRPAHFRPSHGLRRRRGVPRWLLVLLAGVALGAGGVLFVAASYGPARLSVAESEQMYRSLNAATLENQRLQEQLGQAEQLRQQAQTQTAANQLELEAMRTKLAAQQADILALVARLPPDPRGTSPGIPAATFRNLDNRLDYQVLIVQNEQAASNFTGKMTLIVEGSYPGGRTATLDLPAVDVSIGRYGFVNGQAPLPATFTARQATIRLTQGAQSRSAATRTLLVR